MLVPGAEATRGGLAMVGRGASALVPDSADGIVLNLRGSGASCTLSKHLPSYITRSIAAYVDGALLGPLGLARRDVAFWAIHPGGKRIVEAVQDGLGLADDDAPETWAVLSRHGNMLAPSILYVLKAVLERERTRARGNGARRLGLCFSFSPGISVEGLVLEAV